MIVLHRCGASQLERCFEGFHPSRSTSKVGAVPLASFGAHTPRVDETAVPVLWQDNGIVLAPHQTNRLHSSECAARDGGACSRPWCLQPVADAALQAANEVCSTGASKRFQLAHAAIQSQEMAERPHCRRLSPAK
jgi:hypothetical protein